MHPAWTIKPTRPARPYLIRLLEKVRRELEPLERRPEKLERLEVERTLAREGRANARRRR